MERPQTGATEVEQAGACFVMESRVKTCRTMLAAVAVAALAGNASLAQHGGGKSAPGHGAAHHQSSAPGASEGGANPAGKIAPTPRAKSKRAPAAPRCRRRSMASQTRRRRGRQRRRLKASAGKTGAAVQGIDLVRPDDGYASLRRRAMRSTLIANAPKKIPTIVPPGNIVVHPPISSPGADREERDRRDAHRAPAFKTWPSRTRLRALRSTGAPPTETWPTDRTDLANGNVAKTSIGGNAGEVRHENPHPVPVAGAIHSTGLSGTTMGHPAVNAAALGGPAHIVSGIGGGSMRPKY